MGIEALLGLPGLDAATSVALGAPPAAAPAPMLAPTPAPVAPVAPAPAGPAPHDLAGILKTSMPLILAGLAAKKGGPLAAASMLQGFTQAMQRRRALEQEQVDREFQRQGSLEARRLAQERVDQERRTQAAKYLDDVAQSIGKLPDAASRAKALELADRIGQEAFGLAPGAVNQLVLPPVADPHATDAKDAAQVLEQIRKEHGDNYATLYESNALVPFKGRQTPIQEIAALAGLAVRDAKTGKVISPPKPAAKLEKHDEDWYISEAIGAAQDAKGSALTRSETMRAAEKGRKKWADLGRAPEKATAAGDGLDQVGLRSAETWRANQLAMLERVRRGSPGDPSIGIPATPALTEEQVQAERRRIEESYQRMRAQAGIAPPAPPAADPARMISPGAADRQMPNTPQAPPQPLEPMTSRQGRPQVQVGAIVTLRDGRRGKVVAVNPDGTIQIDPVP